MAAEFDLVSTLATYRARRGVFDVVEVPDRVRARRAPRLDDVRLLPLYEGRCVQTLPIGSFDDEAGVLAQLHEEFLPAYGLRAHRS